MEMGSASSVAPLYTLSVQKQALFSTHLISSGNLNPPPRLKQTSSVIICCARKSGQIADTQRNYYDLLGVPVDSDAKEIKEAYRRLQKKHHPDIAGKEGHEYTLLLNKAYKVLMREELRKEYDISIGQTRLHFSRSNSGLGQDYSSWNGPLRPQALFVDGSACIGCQECVHHARNTLVMDGGLGCARVKIQYGDEDEKIQVAVDSCPVNCIHWVDRDDLAVLEFLSQPQAKKGYGVFGGGWERPPKNIFAAAKVLTKQLERDQQTRDGEGVTVDEETAAQSEARSKASWEMKKERLRRTVWDLLGAIFR